MPTALGPRGLVGAVVTAVFGLVVGVLPGTVSPADAKPDPRWHFYTRDTTRYSSPWFAGGHRIMVPYGCTRAPYYQPDPRCRRQHGFHHGIDVAMACGTRLYAGRGGRVLSPSAPGRPGPAYGVHPFRIRSTVGGRVVDILIGHARRVYVDPHQRVRRGQLIARASDSGAPDGCHLHFEVRPKDGGYTDAIDPRRWIALAPLARPRCLICASASLRRVPRCS